MDSNEIKIDSGGGPIHIVGSSVGSRNTNINNSFEQSSSICNRSQGAIGPQRELIRLHEILAERFDVEELRTLCFHLGLDYDDLRGEGKHGKARELVAFLERRDRIEELIVTGKRLRSDVAWDVDDAASSIGAE